MDIVIDFDGTCVTNEFPNIGKDIGAIPVLKKLVECGDRLILFTMRSDKNSIDLKIDDGRNIIHRQAGNYLTRAVKWFEENNIPLYGINTNPSQSEWTDSPKAFGQIYIDDAALGAPLIFDPSISERPFIDWSVVEEMICNFKKLI